MLLFLPEPGYIFLILYPNLDILLFLPEPRYNLLFISNPGYNIYQVPTDPENILLFLLNLDISCSYYLNPDTSLLILL